MTEHTTPPPWSTSYPNGLDWRLDRVAKPVTAIIEQAASAYPDRVCMDFMDKQTTYAETLDLVNRAAKGLQALGVRKGDRVGLCLPNSPYYVICYFAALKAGATVVNFNPLYTAGEIRHQIVDSGVSVMATLDLKALYSKVAQALHGTSLHTVVVCSLAEALPPVKSWLFQVFKRGEIAHYPHNLENITFDQLIGNGDDPAPVKIDPNTDIALLQYTGGTTGVPKGAMLTHANVSSNTEQVRLWLGETDPGGETFLCVIPFFHVFAMTAAMNLGLASASTLILLPRFDLEQVLKTIDAKHPTVFPAVPTIYAAITNHAELARYDMTSIHFCISGGAALPVEVKHRFEELTGCVLVEGYGLSEASPVVTCNPPKGVNKAGSIGIPIPGTQVEIRDLDRPEQIQETGEKGEVVVRGPQVMPGYWDRPDETAQVFTGGWLRTGDVGHMDADGYVFLTDRLKDVIICSGFKVYPRNVEDALYEHESVAEVIVIGIPDDYRGETPKAFVKLKGGSEATSDDLMAFAHDRLNPIERPSAVELRDALPKTLIGKLSKKELVEEEAQKRAAEQEGAGS